MYEEEEDHLRRESGVYEEGLGCRRVGGLAGGDLHSEAGVAGFQSWAECVEERRHCGAQRAKCRQRAPHSGRRSPTQGREIRTAKS